MKTIESSNFEKRKIVLGFLKMMTDYVDYFDLKSQI